MMLDRSTNLHEINEYACTTPGAIVVQLSASSRFAVAHLGLEMQQIRIKGNAAVPRGLMSFCIAPLALSAKTPAPKGCRNICCLPVQRPQDGVQAWSRRSGR